MNHTETSAVLMKVQRLFGGKLPADMLAEWAEDKRLQRFWVTDAMEGAALVGSRMAGNFLNLSDLLKACADAKADRQRKQQANDDRKQARLSPAQSSQNAMAGFVTYASVMLGELGPRGDVPLEKTQRAFKTCQSMSRETLQNTVAEYRTKLIRAGIVSSDFWKKAAEGNA